MQELRCQIQRTTELQDRRTLLGRLCMVFKQRKYYTRELFAGRRHGRDALLVFDLVIEQRPENREHRRIHTLRRKNKGRYQLRLYCFIDLATTSDNPRPTNQNKETI